MKEQLTVPGALERAQPATPALDAVRAAAELAKTRVARPLAESSHDAYDRHWERWARWCGDLGHAALPVRASLLCVYLEWLTALPRSPSTVRQAMSAIATLDRWHRTSEADPTPTSVAESPTVERWLKAWEREHPRAPRKQAAMIETRELGRLLDVVGRPSAGSAKRAHLLRASRDRALLLTGICGAFRIAELAEMHVSDPRFIDRGLKVRLQSSKTDQSGEGKFKDILPMADAGLCPVEAMRAWLRGRGDWDGPLFCPVERDGTVTERSIGVRTLQKIISGYAKRAGLTLVSSHSMRATMATLAYRRGHSLEDIAEHMGHSRLETTRGYIRRGALKRERNPTGGLFDE